MYLDLKKQSNQERVKTTKETLFFKEANFASELSPYTQQFIKDGYCDLK